MPDTKQLTSSIFPVMINKTGVSLWNFYRMLKVSFFFMERTRVLEIFRSNIIKLN